MMKAVTLILVISLILLFYLIISKKSIEKKSIEKKSIENEYFIGRCPPVKKGFGNTAPFFHFHFIEKWTPQLSNNNSKKQYDMYFKSIDFKNVIYENVKDIYRISKRTENDEGMDVNELWNSNINFDNYRFHYEDARENLSKNYKCDIDIDLELKSIGYNLKYMKCGKKDNEDTIVLDNKAIIKDCLMSLTDPDNLTDGFHIYFVPYVGRNSLAKTVFQNNTDKDNDTGGFPVSFIGLYTEDSDGNIIRTIDVLPEFGKNMLFSKTVAQQLGFLFGLSPKNNKPSNLMNIEQEPPFEIINKIIKQKEGYATVEQINDLIERKFSGMSNQQRRELFNEVIMFTTFDLNKENFTNLNTEGQLIDGLYNFFNQEDQKTNAYEYSERLGELFSEHYINKPIILDEDYENDSRVKKMEKFKRKRDFIKYRKAMKDIFTLIDIKHLSIILFKLINQIPVELEYTQVNQARNIILTLKAELASELVSDPSLNKDIIDKDVDDLTNINKALCLDLKYEKEPCDENSHACYKLIGNEQLQCCSNRNYYKCLEHEYSIKGKDFRKDEDSLGDSEINEEDLEELNSFKYQGEYDKDFVKQQDCKGYIDNDVNAKFADCMGSKDFTNSPEIDDKWSYL